MTDGVAVTKSYIIYYTSKHVYITKISFPLGGFTDTEKNNIISISNDDSKTVLGTVSSISSMTLLI